MPVVDPALLHSAFHGDSQAQYVLYRACYPHLMAICRRYHADDQAAEASVNAGFLKIITHLDKYRQQTTPWLAWLRRVMINCIIDEFRRDKQYRTYMVFPQEGLSGTDTGAVWNDAEGNLGIEYLETLLQRLPPMSQKVFNLFAIDGYTHAEIAALLGISEGTSKWHVNAARRQLQTWIQTEKINVFG
jgi:RNA polymerase sigma factor (sigma-70 family)